MSTRTASGATPIEPGAAPVAADLLLVVGHGRMSVHPIGTRDLVIGRSKRCDIAIDHATMSRRHAAVEAGTPPALRDLGSTNGTFVNDVRVERHMLAEGDMVRAGATSLRVRLSLGGRS